jgi:hypothetical protein
MIFSGLPMYFRHLFVWVFPPGKGHRDRQPGTPAGYTPLGCSFHGKSCEQWMITRGIWLWKPPCWKIWTFHWFQTKQTLALIWTCYWQKVAGLKPIANRIWFFAARIWALEGLASGKSPDVPSFRMILLLHCHHGFPSSMARYSCIHFLIISGSVIVSLS